VPGFQSKLVASAKAGRRVAWLLTETLRSLVRLIVRKPAGSFGHLLACFGDAAVERHAGLV
jgi:hypothetical protein